ncbi:MAG: isochorismatase family protein [DPANN group archaeon]|nr:isochorismatase family protein [DPANN group archaeon]
MKLLFWNVDTQKDFMHKTGSLYVPGAEKIIPNLMRLTQYAREHKQQIILSRDTHDKNSAELKRNGGIFPDHCMSKTEGYKNIPETEPKNLLVIPTTEGTSMAFLESEFNYSPTLNKILSHSGELVFEKDSNDVFNNYYAGAFVANSKAEAAVVYGVATDYCVKCAALGLRKAGLEVYLVTDAIAAVDKKGGKSALEEMIAAGVKPVTTNQVLRGELK